MPPPHDRHYEHRFHAGNVGDVWKHVALIALFDHLGEGPHLAVDTHAGAGWYPLGPTGEWTEGLGRLTAQTLSPSAPNEVLRYLEHASIHPKAARGADAPAPRGDRLSGYPGSPLFLAALVGPSGRVIAHELSEPVARELSAVAAFEPRIEARPGDGLAALEATLAAPTPGLRERVLFIDPPFADRREWELTPEALVAALRAHPGLRTMLWYPVKSLARPNAMLLRLEQSGVRGVAIELITSPLTSKKNRLNGSGLLLLEPADDLVGRLAALASWLGPRLAVHDGYFQVRVNGFGKSLR